MAGSNRALLLENVALAKAASSGERPCIFLSHVTEDKEAVKAIGDYIMERSDIDIYLDINDQQLQTAVKNNDAVAITRFIEKGIRASTHVMCLYSETTVRSWWVPYELGYGKRSNAEVSSLKLKGDIELPAYLSVAEKLLGTESLNKYLEKIVGMARKSLGYHTLNERLIAHSVESHPLDKYLDWNK